MKKISLLLVLMVSLVGYSLAQRTISGTITDDVGEPLIGASVVAKGTTVGTITDIDGSYSLGIADDVNTLVISYTGFDTREMALGASNVVDIVLSAGVELNEVVVTALGVAKEKKALGYGVTTVDEGAVTNRNETDVARILRGKTTGVDITSTSGLAGSGTSIIIRGFSSISGSNQPLFVVDGIPFNTDSNTSENFITGGAASSNRFADLDPNNIAEINILKGLSATVLYGEAGRNGVVLVTTKTGQTGRNINKGMEISFTQRVTATSVANLPEYQNTYGNGFSGNFGWFFSNWGPSFDTRGTNGIGEDGTVPHPYVTNGFADQYPGTEFKPYEYRPYESVEEFFQTGIGLNTSVGLAKQVGENTQVKANYSYLRDEGFTPDLVDGSSSNNYTRQNFSLGANTKLDNGISINGTFNFVDSDRLTPPIGTSDGSGPTFDSDPSLFSDVLYTPRSIDLFGLPFQSELDNSQTYYRQTSQITNPLWTLNNAKDTEEVNRFFGNINLGYNFTDDLSINYRISLDKYTQFNNRLLNKGGNQFRDGLLSSSTYNTTIIDNLLSLNYDRQLNDDFNLSLTIGGNARKEDEKLETINSTQQFVYGLATHDNYIETQATTRNTFENTLGIFGTATVGYKSFLYLGLQGRNDFTSTLEKENRSIFYPSANISFIPTEAFTGLANNKVVDYLKFRFGVGTSAGYPDPYQTRNILSSSTNDFQTPAGTTINLNQISNRLGNPNLTHESHREFELGVEGNFFKNRIGIDLSLYDKRSSDLIIDLDIDPASGFRNTTVNAAELENRGVELGAWVQPFKGDLQYRLGINFTRNRNLVLGIADGVASVPIAGFTNLGNFALEPLEISELPDGETAADYPLATERDGFLYFPFATIQGSKFERVDGELLVTDIGFYQATDDISPIGDPNPDYTISYLNTLSYKGVSLFVNLNYTKGGDIYSGTASTLLARGNTIDTEFDRFLPFVLDGVTEDGNPNTTQVYAADAFFEGFFGPNEGAIFDGTTLRLREISLGYTVPKNLLENLPFGSLSINFAAENIWFKAFNFPEGINFDPEVLSVGVGNGRGIDFITGPTAKRFGVSLNASF